jgi:hypothetical protein
MGSKFITLGSKITFLAAKVGSKNYFFGQQKFIFWGANIFILVNKNFGFFTEFFSRKHDF